MKRQLTLAAASALALAAASPASAAIIVSVGAGAVQPDENVLTNTAMTGTTVMGTTNQSGSRVSVSSSEALTTNSSNGQARFLATDSSLDNGTIFLSDGGTFTSAEFNLFNPFRDTTSVVLTVNGIAQSFDLKSGSNFFGFSATNGDVISSILFDTNGTGVADLRQVRVGGIAAAAAVPEPGTWALMLLGFGAVGATMRRRRPTRHLFQVA